VKWLRAASGLSIIAAMAVGSQIQAWRDIKGHSVEELASKLKLSPEMLEAIEAGEKDPTASVLESVAEALKIPIAWLFTHPSAFKDLFEDLEEAAQATSPDPVTERILAGSRLDRSLYILLTALIQSAEPPLLRAAEVSLRSLVKQSKHATVPWQSRPSGHFEPPND